MKEFFYNEGAETLAQVAQRGGGGCPIPGHIEEILAHGRRVGG